MTRIRNLLLCLTFAFCAACNGPGDGGTAEEAESDAIEAGDGTARFVHDAGAARRDGFVDFSFEYPDSWAVESQGPVDDRGGAVVITESAASGYARLIFVGGISLANRDGSTVDRVAMVPELSEIVQTQMIDTPRYGAVERLSEYRAIRNGLALYRYSYRAFPPDSGQGPGEAIVATVIAALPVESTYGVVLAFEAYPGQSGIETLQDLNNDDAYRLLIDTFEIEGMAVREALEAPDAEG